MKKVKMLYLLIPLALLVGFLILPKGEYRSEKDLVVSDTIEVPYLINRKVFKDVAKPDKVFIQTKKDTSLRKSLERNKILLSVLSTRKGIEVTRIGANGTLTRDFYEPFTEFQVDSTVRIYAKRELRSERRKKRKKVFNRCVYLATGLLVFILVAR